MLTLLSGAASGFALVGVSHHLTGADVGGAAVSNLAGLWHALSTVVVPTITVAVSVAFAFLSSPSARSPQPTAGNDRAPVLAYARDDSPSASGAGGEGQPGERPAVRPVDRFYRVTFADERGFRLWTERVVEFTSILREIFPALDDMRPVVFVPLRPSRATPLQAYVSAGARGLAAHISGGATVDPAPIAASELPRGLTMLFGEGVDAAEYENRNA
ncbi:MAG: hypothetical protein ABR499_05605 [Gemmatimonadaceae bacterium]